MMIASISGAGKLLDLLWAGITPEILLRLGFATLAGTFLGIERERHGRAAGLRTTLLVCLAACVAMILSDTFYQQSLARHPGSAAGHPDPARLAAGVLSGMGFLGAGVIIRESTHLIRGVTTAAAIWLVTIIGLAFGAGAIGLGLLITVMSLMILGLVPCVESLIKNDWYADLAVSFKLGECSIDRIAKALLPLGVVVNGIDVVEDLKGEICHATLHLRFKRQNMILFTDAITRQIRELPGVSRISFQS